MLFSRAINAAAEQIYSGSVRSAAIAIHVLHQCTQGIENPFLNHWRGLHPDVRIGIAKALTDRLVVLRERAAVINNSSDAEINRTIEELIEKLNALPVSVGKTLANAIVAETLTVSPAVLINKLDMLSAEMPDQAEAELLNSTSVPK